jgi:hypothetical protein
MRVVLVGDEPLPPDIASTPQDKVDWYFRHADMVVYLATPDDRLESGEIRTRQNIIDEHRLGQSLPHVQHRLMVFKASEVTLPSNINPVYERLPLDDIPWIVDKVSEQARVWGVLPRSADVAIPAPTAAGAAGREDVERGESPAAIEQGQVALRQSAEWLDGATQGDRPAVRRAQLALAGLMATTSDFLGVSLMSSLFGEYERLVLSDAERRVLLRTALHRRGEANTPLHWTLVGLSRASAVDLLIDFASSDQDVEVQRRALELLTRVPSLTSSRLAIAVARAASDDWSPLRVAAHEFARAHRIRPLVEAVTSENAAAADPLLVRATRLLTQVASRPGPVMTEYVASFEVERLNPLEAEIVAHAARVGWTHIHAALENENASIRQFAVGVAAAKGGLPRDRALARIAEDKSPGVRLELARQLLLVGDLDSETFRLARSARDDDQKEFHYDDERALSRAFLDGLPTADLKDAVRWNGVHGPDAYAVLVAREEIPRAQVHRDIHQGFTRLTDELRTNELARVQANLQAELKRELTEVEADAVAQHVDKALTDWLGPKLRPWMTRQFRASAFAGLSKAARAPDLPIAREFAESEHADIRSEILAIFEQVATRNDGERLVAMARASYAPERERALEKALALTPAGRHVELLLACIADGTAASWCVKRLPESPQGLHTAFGLLNSEDHAVRAAAADLILDRLRRDRWPDLVAAYMNGWHYYNVLVAFDRRLHPLPWEQPTSVALPAAT